MNEFEYLNSLPIPTDEQLARLIELEEQQLAQEQAELEEAESIGRVNAHSAIYQRNDPFWSSWDDCVESYRHNVGDTMHEVGVNPRYFAYALKAFDAVIAKFESSQEN